MLKTIFTSALTAALVCACFYALRQADASRNSSGTFSLYTPGNPVVTGTTISSAWANNTLSDIKTEITDSLSRSGKGGMLAGKQLQIDDGTFTAPGLTSTSENGSGLYRIGSNDWGFSINQVKRQEWTTAGSSITGTFAVSGVSTLTGNVGAGVTPLFPLHVLKTGSSGSTASASTSAMFESNGAHLISILAPNANNEGICFGDVANSCRGTINYFNSTNGSADQMQITTGGSVRATVSNSGLTLGTGSDALVHTNGGSCTLNAGAPATCTATVASGARCMATYIGTGVITDTALETSVTTTTLTVTGPNGNSKSVNYICF